jgi:DNA-binding MurR/RpiR family transcriptional regulator
LLPSLTRAERRVAQVLLGHYPLAGLETVQALAQRAGVSTATVLRFVARLGFTSYPEFQRSLREQLAATLQSPLVRAGTALAPGPEPEAGTAAHYFHARAVQLRDMAATLPAEELEAAAALLAEPRHVVRLLGGRYSASLARYAADLLRGLRPDVDAIEGQTQTWADRLLDINRRTVLLLFDFRRYQRDVITFAELAAGRGARLVVVTDPWYSEAARHAERVLAVPVQSESIYDTLVPAMAVVEALVFAVARRLGERAKQRIAMQERLRAPFMPAKTSASGDDS